MLTAQIGHAKSTELKPHLVEGRWHNRIPVQPASTHRASAGEPPPPEGALPAIEQLQQLLSALDDYRGSLSRSGRDFSALRNGSAEISACSVLQNVYLGLEPKFPRRHRRKRTVQPIQETPKRNVGRAQDEKIWSCSSANSSRPAERHAGRRLQYPSVRPKR